MRLLFAWQFPHFLAIAWIYKEDYARAGLLMLPQRDPEGNRAFLEILATSLALIPLSLVPNNPWHDRNCLFLRGSFAQFEPAIFCIEGLGPSIPIAGQSALACDCHLPSSHLRDDGHWTKHKLSG